MAKRLRGSAMTSPDFASVNMAALERYPGLLETWLPGGRMQGQEYVCGSLQGGSGDSCKVNCGTGKWADFATGEKGGDGISLFASIHGLSQGEAARRLAVLFMDSAKSRSMAQASTGTAEPAKAPTWVPILPVPADAPEAHLVHPRHGKPTRTWTYRDRDGAPLGHVCRFDPSEGKKQILPLTYCRGSNGKREWRWQTWPEPRPLYGLDRLQARPEVPVLVVEGEKAADAARAISEPLVVISWPGGCNAVGKADWTPLQGRLVCLWPDNDAPGFKAMLAVAALAEAVGFTLAGIVLPSAEWAKGQDIADFPDWTWEDLDQEIKARKVSLAKFREAARERHGIGPAIVQEQAGAESDGLHLVCAANVEPEPVNWIWPGHVAAGVVHVVDGLPGVGKSMLSCYLAGVLTTGTAWPDGTRCNPGNVLLVNLEDDLSRTLRPRLGAAGADLNRVQLFEDSEGGFTLPGDLAKLESAISRHGIALCVIDPLMAVLDSKVNSYRDQDVRRVLAALKAMCGRTSCAVVLVRHLTKAVGGPAIQRGGGSIGIIGAARVGLLLAVDQQDDARRILATVKNNLGPFDPKQSTSWTIAPGPRLEYAGAVNMSADDLLQAQDEKRGPGRPDQERTEAQEWLCKTLADGPIPSAELRGLAEAAGLAWRTVERARKEITATVKQGGRWVVALKGNSEDQDRQKSQCMEIGRSSQAEDVNLLNNDEFQDGQKEGEAKAATMQEAETPSLRPGEILCAGCGRPFTPKNPSARYCSHECFTVRAA